MCDRENIVTHPNAPILSRGSLGHLKLSNRCSEVVFETSAHNGISGPSGAPVGLWQATMVRWWRPTVTHPRPCSTTKSARPFPIQDIFLRCLFFLKERNSGGTMRASFPTNSPTDAEGGLGEPDSRNGPGSYESRLIIINSHAYMAGPFLRRAKSEKIILI